MNLMEDAPEIDVNQDSIVNKKFIEKSFDCGLNNAK